MSNQTPGKRSKCRIGVLLTPGGSGEKVSVILNGSKECSVLLHGSEDARSRLDYFRKLVAIEKEIWQPFCFSTSTEQTAKLENSQNASHNKYTKLHLKTNTCNSEQKNTALALQISNILMKFSTATLSISHVDVINFGATSRFSR